MKIVIESYAKQAARKSKRETWHPWFAWHPIIVDSGKSEMLVWLEVVQRAQYGTTPLLGLPNWLYCVDKP